MLQRIEVSEQRIVLEVRGGIGEMQDLKAEGLADPSRSGRPKWLPGSVSRSAFRHSSQIRFKRLRPSDGRIPTGEWQHLIEIREVETRAELARRARVSRARVTQVLGHPGHEAREISR